MDPDFSLVALLCHFDVDPLVDSSNNAVAMSLVGTAAIDTTNVLFGAGSLDMTSSQYNIGALAGWNSQLNSILTSTSDWTIEGWFWPNNNGEFLIMNVGQAADSGSASDGITINTNGSAMSVGPALAGGGTGPGTSATVNYSAWNHFALVRYNNGVTIYLNGVGGGAETDWGTASPVAGSPMVHFGSTIGGTSATGYMDECRITAGLARYTANFTPPNAPFWDPSQLPLNLLKLRFVPASFAPGPQIGVQPSSPGSGSSTTGAQQAKVFPLTCISNLDGAFPRIWPPKQNQTVQVRQ